MTQKRSFNDGVFLVLTALVLLAPLPLASNRPWSWSLLALGVSLLALVWTAGRLRGVCRGGVALRRLLLPAVPFLLALVWAWLQTSSWLPGSLAHPVWADASLALGRDLPSVISGDPQRTGQAAMRLLAYGLIFVLATQLGSHPGRASQGMKAVAVAVILYSAYALLMHGLELEYILWLPKWAYPGDATGTFVGRAAFGAFAGIGMLACLALALKGLAGKGQALPGGSRLEAMLSGSLPWIAAALFLLLAVLASHSRGALAVAVVGLVVLILAAVLGRVLRFRHALILLVAIAIPSLVIVLVFGEGTLARLMGEGDLTGDRPNLLRLTWAAIADAPLTGHGLGAFEETFKPYRDPSLPRPVIYDFAHNTWLETIMDLGWPMGLCLLGSVVLTVAVCVRGLLHRRRDQIHPAFAVAVAALLGTQALADFTVQIPALAAFFAYILGIGYAQSWSRSRDAT